MIEQNTSSGSSLSVLRRSWLRWMQVVLLGQALIFPSGIPLSFGQQEPVNHGGHELGAFVEAPATTVSFLAYQGSPAALDAALLYNNVLEPSYSFN